jgi:hypothetical protein
VFVMFGRQECLDLGNKGLEDFRSAMEKVLDSVGKVTPNMVLIESAPFEQKASPLSDMKAENEALKAYNAVVQQIALWRHLQYCGFEPKHGAGELRFEECTTDGCTLNSCGRRVLASRIASALDIGAIGLVRGGPRLFVQPGGMLIPADKVTQAVQAKNRLWHDYWRPSNWAFLHGDRTQQPSSRDPLNPQLRFFPAEQEKYLPLIKDAEDKVYKLVEEATKKLP